MGGFAFVTYSAAFGIGPERDHGDFLLCSGVGEPIAQLLRDDGRHAVAGDEFPDQLGDADATPLSGAAVLELANVQQALAVLDIKAILPFKVSAKLETIAARQGLRLLAPAAQLARQLENKLQLPGIAAEAGVRIPATEQVAVDEALLLRAATLQYPLVFQPAVGFAGAETSTVASPDDLRALVAGSHRSSAGKLAELIEGPPVTVNGVVLGDGPDDVLVGAVAHQLTGIAECTAAEFGSCGNDWSLPLDAGDEQAVRNVAAQVGVAIAARGFRGIFGIDLVLAADGPVLIELNPRMTASLGLQLQLQQRVATPAPTLLDAHLIAFEQPTHASLDDLRVHFAPSVGRGDIPAAASLLLFNTASQPMTPQRLEPGVWSLDDDGALQYKRPGYRHDHLLHDDEFVLLPQSPPRPVPVASELARLVFARRIAADDRCRRLDDFATRVAVVVREALASG